MISLNERISKIIEYSEMTSSEFADTIEVQRSSISHITSGRNKPSLDFLIKVKEQFPELEWDWIISGKGEMTKSKEEEPLKEEKKKSTPLPDLFSIIEDKNFGLDEVKTEKSMAELPNSNSRESSITIPNKDNGKISDSQRLENIVEKNSLQNTDFQKNKIKRIVLFYENGKFENFEP